MKGFRRNKKAVSTVIATIIIVAIAIVMSIAVAYWMLGLGGAFTRFEKLEFTSGYCVARPVNATLTYFDIRMKLKNTGSSALTISEIFVNGVPWSDLANTVSTNLLGPDPTYSSNVTLEPGGAKDNGLITLKSSTTWKSGMAVEVMIRTAGGKDYPKVIILP
jgi:hypothetical protein